MEQRREQNLVSITDHLEQSSAPVLSQNTARVASSYEEPIYLGSKLTRKLALRNPRVFSSDDKITLDFMFELESMKRHQPITVEFLPKKKKARQNDEEVTILRKNHNIITEISTKDEEQFLSALRILGMDPRTAFFMITSSQANTLQEYCWPVIPKESASITHLTALQKRDLHHDLMTTDHTGGTSDQRYLLLSNELKSFTPKIIGNRMIWSENFHILPSCRVEERDMRTPPTIYRKLVRQKMHLLDDNAVPIWREDVQFVHEKQCRKKDEILSAASSTIHAPSQSLLYHHLPHPADELRVLIRPGRRSSRQEQDLKRAAVELSLARHVEALADSLLHTVFEFFDPLVELTLSADTDTTSTHDTAAAAAAAAANTANTASKNAKDSDDNLLIEVNHHNVGDQTNPSVSITHGKIKHGNVKKRKLSVDFALGENNRKRIRQDLDSDLLEEEDEGEMNEKEMKKHLFCSHDKDFLRRVIQPRLLELKKRPGSGQITWEHILLALQCLPQSSNKELLLVHEDLPPFPLTQDVLDRVQRRLFHRFAEVKQEGRQVSNLIQEGMDVRSSYKPAPTVVDVNNTGGFLL